MTQSGQKTQTFDFSILKTAGLGGQLPPSLPHFKKLLTPLRVITYYLHRGIDLTVNVAQGLIPGALCIETWSSVDIFNEYDSIPKVRFYIRFFGDGGSARSLPMKRTKKFDQ